jgi:hypothetical protein
MNHCCLWLRTGNYSRSHTWHGHITLDWVRSSLASGWNWNVSVLQSLGIIFIFSELQWGFPYIFYCLLKREWIVNNIPFSKENWKFHSAQHWTWETYRGSGCKVLCILNTYPLEKRLVGLRAGLGDASRGGFCYNVVIDHCPLMEKLWLY